MKNDTSQITVTTSLTTSIFPWTPTILMNHLYTTYWPININESTYTINTKFYKYKYKNFIENILYG